MLKLSEARALIMDSRQGKYINATEKTRKSASRHLQTAVRLLNNPFVEKLKQSDYARLWQLLADENVSRGQHGLRIAEQITSALRSGLIWLESKGKISEYVLPRDDWKSQLAILWATTTGVRAEKKTHRYIDSEVAALYEALPKADPRLRLAFEIGVAGNLGLFAQAHRKDIIPTTEHEFGVIEMGRNKHARAFVLNDDHRSALEAAILVGVLSELEAAFQRGVINNYRLIPGEFLTKGKAPIKNAMEEVSDRALKQWWRKLERAANVPYSKGRGWAGIRRYEEARTATSSRSTPERRPIVNESRISQLKAIQSKEFDLAKLVRLCEEANFAASKEAWLSVAMVTRALVDHVPPIFGYDNFTEVANNYGGKRLKSFKANMSNLDNFSKKIADACLHGQVGNREVLPNRTQVDFSPSIDVLLGEVVRILG